jgi:hypothetical protein
MPRRTYTRPAVDRLLTALLDEPNPTPTLKAAVNDFLTATRHPLRDRTRDPLPQPRKREGIPFPPGFRGAL